MARPQIPDVVKERIEEIHERYRGYPANSFQEALTTVADLAEQESREAVLDEKLPFRYEVEDSSSGIELRLSPKTESNFAWGDGLETPKAVIDSSEVFDQLNQIEGVNRAHSVTSDDIQISIEDEVERSFDEVVDDIFRALSSLIQHHENKIEQIEQRAEQYASRKDSTDQ